MLQANDCHPSLHIICELPADPRDLTHEHVLAICAGDVTGFAQDIARLANATRSDALHAGADEQRVLHPHLPIETAYAVKAS